MRLRCLTDKGGVRKENQDNYWSVIAKVDGRDCGVVCLCDGMGGLKNGGDASKIAVNSIRRYVTKNFDFVGLKSVIEQANSSIYSIGGDSRDSMMGTTCTVLMCEDGVYRILHVGDTRVYLLRNGNSYRLTDDHSAVSEFKIDKVKDPALWKKYRNKLTRCLGAKSTVVVEEYTGRYLDGDVFLVCSDGCWHLFDEEPLTLSVIGNLENLFSRCKMSGETDNITACVLSV